MNNLEEIKFQNKFDYFAKMYGFIARSMMEAEENGVSGLSGRL